MQLGSGNGGIYPAIPLTLIPLPPRSRFRPDVLRSFAQFLFFKKPFAHLHDHTPNTTSLLTQLIMHVLLFLDPSSTSATPRQKLIHKHLHLNYVI